MLLSLTKGFKKLSDFLNQIAIWISVIYTGILVSIVFLGVIFRSFGYTLSWSNELSRWLIMSLAYIAASIALKEGSHVGITILVKILPRKLKKIIIFMANFLVVIFLYYMVKYGFNSALQGINSTGTIIQIPLIYVKIHIPIGGIIMFVHMIYYFLGLIVHKEPEKFMMSQTRTT